MGSVLRVRLPCSCLNITYKRARMYIALYTAYCSRSAFCLSLLTVKALAEKRKRPGLLLSSFLPPFRPSIHSIYHSFFPFFSFILAFLSYFLRPIFKYVHPPFLPLFFPSFHHSFLSSLSSASPNPTLPSSIYLYIFPSFIVILLSSLTPFFPP